MRFSVDGMGREQIVHPAVGQRIDDEQMRGRRIALRARVLDLLRGAGNLDQRRGERVGPPADMGAELVGGVFARAADRHLHQHGRDRREDHHGDGADHAEAVVVVAMAAEEQPELRQHGDRAGDGRGDRHDQRVAVADMGELVGDHAGDFLAVEHVEQAGRHRDRGVLGIAAGGEGIGLRIVHEIDARHRQPGALRQIAHQAHEIRRAASRRPPARRASTAPACRQFQ